MYPVPPNELPASEPAEGWQELFKTFKRFEQRATSRGCREDKPMMMLQHHHR
jgi:hypothetical protein